MVQKSEKVPVPISRPPINQPAEAADHAAQLSDLLQKNLAATERMALLLERVDRQLAWQRIWSVVKIFIILVPLLLGLIYLPPLFQQVFSQYEQLLNPPTGV